MSTAAAMITPGIVPGFPASLPAHLDQAWLAIVSKPQAAVIATSVDNGVTITLKRQAKQAWGFARGPGAIRPPFLSLPRQPVLFRQRLTARDSSVIPWIPVFMPRNRVPM